MDKEADILKKRFGQVQPFRVPNGYFDDFASKMMESIPSDDVKIVKMPSRKWYQLRPIAIAAASISVAIITITAYFYSSDALVPHKDLAQTEERLSSSYSAIDQAVDYTMMDNADMYAYVSEY